MRNSLVFEKLNHGCDYYARSAREEIRICARGMNKWFGINTRSPEYKKFRLTVRRNKFPHSTKVYVDFWGVNVGRTEKCSYSAYIELISWLKDRYPNLYNRIEVFYVRIDWLKGIIK